MGTTSSICADHNAPAVHLVFCRFAHFGAHSGPDQLDQYLKAPWRSTGGSSDIAAARLLAKIYAGLRRNSEAEFEHQLAAGLSMAFGPRRIYHFLDGDHEPRFFMQFPGAQRHQIMATFHMPPEEWRTRDTRSVRRLDAAVVVGRNQIDFFADLLGPDRVFYVPLGVDTTTFAPADRLESQDETPTVLCVGWTFRDFPLLHDAALLVQASIPAVRFIYICDPMKVGSYSARLMSVPNFTFRTDVSEAELIRAYHQSQVLFLPLTNATANNALLEGMSCGRPIVVTKVGAIPDYACADGATLVMPGDSGAAAKALIDLLNDEPMRRRQGEVNRRQALRFDWRVIAREMEQVYQQVWERGKRGK